MDFLSPVVNQTGSDSWPDEAHPDRASSVRGVWRERDDVDYLSYTTECVCLCVCLCVCPPASLGQIERHLFLGNCYFFLPNLSQWLLPLENLVGF